MKYGVLSDIHGNLEAFNAALKRLKAEGAEKYIFCGDLIGYGPDPEKCVQKFAKLKEDGLAVGVMGNHDAVFAHPDLRMYFNFEALQVLDWTEKQLSARSIRCVSFLPEMHQNKDFAVVHGTPMDPIKEYFANCTQYRTAYPLWEGQVLFVGHTHLPFYMEGDENICHVSVAHKEPSVNFHPILRYVVNPGSVGKPRDNDPRASFGLWDTDTNTFRFLRQSYDFAKTQEKMRAADLPTFLVDSLALGM